MIKEKDVRIGNLVMYDGKVYSISPTDYAETDFDRFEPLLLSEEWLKKMGFKEEEWFKGVYSCGDFSIESRDFQPVVMGHDDFVPFGKPVEYVHHLQNLFYALCGEELTIKEPA